ncbi:unannotated protein [freshwater metagenome]|uniref:Unannotated protein n=1 Tax=freshwater metagenome TaxID=449393 RepID=A0A6J7XUW6_9ZZZZ|nr:trypsin-like serine protease [Actinomycetota bacterium]
MSVQAVTKKIASHTSSKIGAAFIAGALIAGGVATAATNNSAGTNACIDSKTKVMYYSADGTCTKNRTPIQITSNNFDVKNIAATVTPSVVSIAVVSSLGSGTGSGWVYQTNSGSSYIITNNHVIEGAALSGTITVEFSSGEQVSAKIIGRDIAYDIAVLQVEKGSLPVLSIGNSSQISVGDPVIAIGSPLGLASTVTSGIVSALNRPVSAGTVGAESFVNAIQTDAAINPGNSGGALIDSQGRIIGVNSAIATLTNGSASGSIGLGFAIPINEAKRVIDEIISTPTHTSTRPVMGVYFDSTFTGIGAKILKLSPGEAADKAGIPVGAVIRSIGGVKIVDQVSAIVRIRSYAPGSTISVVVELPSSGGSKTYSIKLGSTASNG